MSSIGKYKAVPFVGKGEVMVTANPVVNELDKERLAQYLNGSSVRSSHRLRQLLDAARVVRPALVPADVITMNSHVSLWDPRDGSVERYILAYPDHLDEDGLALSVLSPMGSSLLAAREGEQVMFPAARGIRRMFVESLIFQPERAGKHDL